MRINTRITVPIKKFSKKENQELEKSLKKLKYSKNIGEKDSKEISSLRKELLHAIEQNKPTVDELILKFEELKEEEFTKKHGMSKKDYEIKLKEKEYKRETVPVRACMCGYCYVVFHSDRLYPDCINCNVKRQSAIEKSEDQSLIGKTIKEVYSGPCETIIIFNDNTFKKFNEGDYSYC